MTVAEDIICLGPFSAIHRFAVSRGKTNEEFNATDGVLGFGYSDQPNSAAILRSLSVPERPAWDLSQPPGFRELRPRRFAVFASEDGVGELHLRGHDPAAASGTVQYLMMLNQSAEAPPYRLRLLALHYGPRSLLHFGDGPRALLEAAFDTGSSCVMLPDRQFGALEASPFRALLEAHMLHGAHPLLVTLGGAAGESFTVELPYSAWTHPGGCLGPYDGERLVLGDPAFRRYVVVHDLEGPVRRLGLAPINPLYRFGARAADWGYGDDADGGGGGDGGAAAALEDAMAEGGGLVRLRLDTSGELPARRYLLRLGVGTPRQVGSGRWGWGPWGSARESRCEKRLSGTGRCCCRR